MRFRLCLFVAALLVTHMVEIGAAAERSVTIHRDKWGVPHIYGATAADGAYGLGYAQAQDRLKDIHISLRTGLGTMSEAFGKKYLEQDYIMRLCRNAELAEESWKTLPPHLKEIAENFTAGVQAFSDEHPEAVPEFAVELEPWKIQTIGRAMILRWPLGTIQDDLKNGKKREQPAQRSNQWAVSPSRSADNVAILLSDPHLTWEGLAVMYEARVHAGELHMNGYFLIGSPVMGIGHNQHVGWALTTGGPDTSDVYEMNVRMNPLLEYEYDGQWRKCETTVFPIAVKGETPAIRPAVYTHLGPLITPPDLKTGKAFVGASPYLEQTGLFEQFYRMAMSKNVREFYDAIGMCEFNEQNIMFADTNGDIGYVRSGATPIRPDGYDWNRPVPGNTSKTAWKGKHSIDDLVHIFNPPQGYMQNCNISPENMMVNSPLKPGDYKDYIYNVSWDTNNPRGLRTVQMLDADDSVTRDEAIAITMDVQDYFAPQWKQELELAVSAAGQEKMQDEEFASAVKAILAWDGQFTADKTATSLYKFWRIKCGQEMDLKPMIGGGHLGEEQQAQLLELLAETMAELKSKHGRWDVAWGEIHKVGREGQYFPVGGAEFRSGPKEANFSETLFDVNSREDSALPGKYVAHNGSMAMILMFFHKDGIESLTCTPWGQSGDPTSPHFMDQGEHLYSKRKMKPTWWAEEDLKKNVESTTVLKIAAAPTSNE